MNLRDFASTLTRSWLVVAATAVAGLAGGWVVGSAAHAVYSTTSRVMVIAAAVGSPEDAQQMTSLIRSEMSVYQALAQGTEVTERVAAQVTGVTASQVSDATAVGVTDQVLTLTISLPDREQSTVVAKVLADELAVEIQGLHASPSLVQARAVTAPVKEVSSGVSRGASVAAGGVLGVAAGLIIVWGIASLRPMVASGGALAAEGGLVLRGEADDRAFQQLAAVLSQRLRESGSSGVVLVGTGERVNLGPWSRGLGEQLGAEATAVTAAPNGADPVALRAVSGGEVTVLVADRRDPLREVQEASSLLEAAGADLVAYLVVSDARA